MGFIHPQLELAARVLNETGATGGVALELETYQFYSIYPGMASQKKTFCFCDHCFYGFTRALAPTELPDAVLPRQRFDWLTQRGLLPAYEKSLEDRMAEMIGEMLQDVRKFKSDFLFGMYPYAPFWYYDALIRGSGTPELPCLLFSSAEYKSGYTVDPPRTFSGNAATTASVAHLRRRGLQAMYAGGLYDKGIGSPEAYALAMDPLLRAADGFWAYHELGKAFEPFWEYFPAINRWNREHPGPLPKGDLRVDLMPSAVRWVQENKPDGVTVSDGGITARYDGEAPEVRLVGAGFDSAEAVAKGWQGRGELPPLDGSVFHTGEASIRFEPSAQRSSPTSPYIDQKVAGLPQEGQSYELSFWVKTGKGDDPVRLWVGRANSSQYPAYMHYGNYFLPPSSDWMRVRTHGSHRKYAGPPPLVLRFWCPPTKGKLWLDDVSLRPVQDRTIDIPLNPPADATGWGRVDWKLSPRDARCSARIVDAEDGHDLRIGLYSGDSLAPLEAIVGLKPVVLRLEVHPSAAEPVMLEEVQAGFTPRLGQ
jgi:hypothetical protein